jgi:transposase-like protein
VGGRAHVRLADPLSRLCRDYERTIAHAEDLIKIAMIRLMAARLAGQQTRYHGIRATTTRPSTWVHLRTTNPIESTFSTVGHRTKITRGPGSKAAARRSSRANSPNEKKINKQSRRPSRLRPDQDRSTGIDGLSRLEDLDLEELGFGDVPRAHRHRAL